MISVNDAVWIILDPLILFILTWIILFIYSMYLLCFKHRKWKINITLSVLLFLFILLVLMVSDAFSSRDENRRIYDEAVVFSEKHDYISAYEILNTIPGYGPSSDFMDEHRQIYYYQLANKKRQDDDLIGAIDLYIEILDYEDSEELMKEVMVQWLGGNK